MIPISKDFSLQRTSDCWILHHFYMTKPKEGEEAKRTSKKTYHGTLQQACGAIVDRSVADVPRARKMIAQMENLEVTLQEYIELKMRETK